MFYADGTVVVIAMIAILAAILLPALSAAGNLTGSACTASDCLRVGIWICNVTVYP